MGVGVGGTQGGGMVPQQVQQPGMENYKLYLAISLYVVIITSRLIKKTSQRIK